MWHTFSGGAQDLWQFVTSEESRDCKNIEQPSFYGFSSLSQCRKLILDLDVAIDVGYPAPLECLKLL